MEDAPAPFKRRRLEAEVDGDTSDNLVKSESIAPSKGEQNTRYDKCAISESCDAPWSICQDTFVCFGMVVDLPVIASPDIKVTPFFVQKAVYLHSDKELRRQNGDPVGRVGDYTNEVLSRLDAEEQLKLQLAFSTSPMAGEPGTTHPKGTVGFLSITIYGPMRLRDDIGHFMTQCEYYLQDPFRCDYNVPYSNPQCLLSPHEDFSMTFDLLKMQQHPVDGFEWWSHDFLTEIEPNDSLVEAPLPGALCTTLKAHQRQALTFLTRREQGLHPTDENTDVWSRQSNGIENRMYGEAIQGSADCMLILVCTSLIDSISNRIQWLPPAACRGGIFADQLGLGKTLSMLAAIVELLSRGVTYAHDMTSQGVIAAKSTLVLVPTALLMDSWIEQIYEHITPGTLSYYKFYGQNRNIEHSLLIQYDIILTTYDTVVADFSQNGSLLYLVHWYRIVLDEAHVIRNSSTKRFQAITALQSHVRWCLTGTPFQSTLNDLESLMRFLKLPITPLTELKKATLTARSNYTKLMALLSSMFLRRTHAVLRIPQPKIYTNLIEFTTEEREEYSRIRANATEALEKAFREDKLKETRQIILAGVLRMRRFCSNGTVDEEERSCSSKSMDREEVVSLLQQSGKATTCYYCSSDILSLEGSDSHDSVILTGCRRVICSGCVSLWTSKTGKCAQCPICGSTQTLECDAVEGVGQIPSSTKYPSKLLALCRDIEIHKDEGKCVVFSSWKKSLYTASTLLKAQKIPFLLVDGSLSTIERKTTLSEFQERPDIPVLLVTLRANVVGWNLSIANRIHILEPQRDLYNERQAIGRVVRFGQRRAVTIMRYIMRGTIEENFDRQRIQESKLAACMGFL